MTNPREKFVRQPLDSKAFLRTPAETLREREIRGEIPVIIEYKDIIGKEFIAIGLPHTLDLRSLNSYKDIFNEKHPGIMLVESGVLLVEGSPLPEIDPSEKPQDIVEKYGEQVYFAWLAKKAGIPIEYWDFDFKDKVKVAIENHEVNDFLGWLMGAALKVFFENRKHSMEKTNEIDKISDKEVGQLKSVFLRHITPELIQYVLKEKGVDISFIDFDVLAIAYCGKSLREMTFGDVVRISDPYIEGRTNNVVRDLDKSRNEYAISTIERLKSQYKTILATAGLDHIITWELALKEI